MQRRQKDPQYAASLKQWHKDYQSFRKSVHCFIEGIETMHSRKYQVALGLFLDSYHYSQIATESPATVSP